MNSLYKKTDITPENYKGQFVLSKDSEQIPLGWSSFSLNSWHLGVKLLPVYTLKNNIDDSVGWCIGYPLEENISKDGNFIIKFNENTDAIDIVTSRFYEKVGGRYLLIFLASEVSRIYLDPYGSLGCVYSQEKQVVASTPTVASGGGDWDKPLIELLGMPESGLWFPFGLTPRKDVRRLLPNHYLCLSSWEVERHWPQHVSDLCVRRDTAEVVREIACKISKNIEIATNAYPAYLSLTAGRDSRMLLACARNCLDKITFFTFGEAVESIDVHVAKIISERLKLRHSVVPVQYATDEERHRWLYLTGHSVGGAIWKIHKSIEALDCNATLLPGIAGEVGRAYYWKRKDHEKNNLKVEELLRRSSMPEISVIKNEADRWLSGLSSYNTFNILDLFYVEQRLGCWAAPQHYGNLTSKYELSPFNHRNIFKNMMQLPYEYKLKQRLAEDICKAVWPELLQWQFNEYTGIKKYKYKIDMFHKKIKNSFF